MPHLPITPDVAALVGSFAEEVENRSLLLDKFSFHKDWGMNGVRAHDATRWSLLRISEQGAKALRAESQMRRDRAQGRNVDPEKAARLRQESDFADRMATSKVGIGDLGKLRASHTRRLVALFRSAFGPRSAVVIGQLEGRLAINLADSLIQNAGMCLDRTFGLPYIPGSAVKGVARAGALEELRAAASAEQARLFPLFRDIFGTADCDFARDGELVDFQKYLPDEALNRRGRISFLSAHPINEARVVVDLTNVHYPKYYQTGDPRHLGSGGETPQPNPFPVVERGARFAFCLVANRPEVPGEILAQARRWVEKALTERGLGAKTAAGYGWFSLQPGELEALLREERQSAEEAARRRPPQLPGVTPPPPPPEPPLDPVARRAEEFLRLDQQAFAEVAKKLAAQDEAGQRAFLSLLQNHKDKKETWKNWRKKKPDTEKTVREVAAKLQIPLP